MGQHVQRKRFDHPEMAALAADAFKQFDASGPGVAISAITHDVNGEHWVYVTQEGELVMGDEPLLPDYQKVV